MCAPDAPPPPDYVGQAKAQGEANLKAGIQSSILSNPNIITPYGRQDVTYAKTGGPQRWVPGTAATEAGWSAPTTGSWEPGLSSADNLYGFDGGQWTDGKRSQWMDAKAATEGRWEAPTNGELQATVTQSFSPEQQKLYDQQTQLSSNLNDTAINGLDRVNDQMDKSFDLSGMSGVQGVDTSTLDPRTVQGSVGGQDEVYNAMMQREAERFGNQRQSTEADLLARGFNPGGTGYDARMNDINRAENDFSLGARVNAGQEQQRLFNMESQGRAQGLNEQSVQQSSQSADRARQIQEALMQRQLPLNEINALRTGNQSNLPNFQQYTGQQIQAAPIFDAAIAQGNNAQQNYQNQVAGSGGLFDLAGAALGALGPIGEAGGLAASIFGKK